MFNIRNDLYRAIPGAPSFTWSEFLFLKSINSVAVPTPEQAANIARTAQLLQGVRDFLKKPIHITSGLRPPVYNEKIVRGAVNSWHTRGLAVDFMVEGLTAEQVRQHLKDNQDALLQGASVELNIPWVHIQLDNRSSFFYPPGRKAVEG
jgi:hypothetical protein